MTESGDLDQLPDDPDYISEDGANSFLLTGPGLYAPGLRGSPTPIFVPSESTPLEEHDSDGAVPPYALWAMKYKRHAHFLGKAEVDIRERYGSGVHTVYVIDDGRKHCMVSRKVGTSSNGCTYCLVDRIDTEAYEELVDDERLTDGIFSDAHEFCLCAVFEAEDAVSNISLVEVFATIGDVPIEYLPPSPTLEFDDPDDGME
jgi:hypothetical protein